MQDEELPGVTPGETKDHGGRPVSGPERRLELEGATPAAAARRDLVVPCGWVLMLCAVALIGSEWMLMGDDLNGQSNGNVEMIAAIVMGYAGLRCLSPSAQHPVAGAISALAGVGIVLQAVFASEQSIGDHVVRYGVGAIAVIAGLTVMWAAQTPLHLPGGHRHLRGRAAGG